LLLIDSPVALLAGGDGDGDGNDALPTIEDGNNGDDDDGLTATSKVKDEDEFEGLLGVIGNETVV